MRVVDGSFLASAILLFISPVLHAQTEVSRTVQGGGITVAGWAGKIDASEERAGQALQNAKFAQEGDLLHITARKDSLDELERRLLAGPEATE